MQLICFLCPLRMVAHLFSIPLNAGFIQKQQRQIQIQIIIFKIFTYKKIHFVDFNYTYKKLMSWIFYMIYFPTKFPSLSFIDWSVYNMMRLPKGSPPGNNMFTFKHRNTRLVSWMCSNLPKKITEKTLLTIINFEVVFCQLGEAIKNK